MRRTFHHRYVLPFLCGVLFTVNLHAQVGWVPAAPMEGGQTAGLVRKVSNGYLFVGTWNSGVFRSSNEGVVWTGCSNGLTLQGSRELALAPDGSLFTSTSTDVYRSADDGSSWQKCNTLSQVKSLACDNMGRIFAGSDSGVFRSMNNGATWERVAPFRKSVTALAVTAANHIFASNDSGVYRSLDNGLTWVRTVAGIPPLTSALRMILFADTSNGDVYAGNQYSELYRSTNNGDTWVPTTPLHSPITTEAITMIFRHPSTRILYVATNTLWKSYDIGTSWQSVSIPLPMKWMTRMVGSGATGALMGGSGGVFFSADSGSVWQPRNAGLTAVLIQSVIADANAVYFGTYTDGILKSANSGNTWSSVSTGLGNRSVNALGYHAPSNTLFASTNSRLYRSSNGGGAWVLSDSGLGHVVAYLRSSNVSQIAMHPSGSIFAYDWYRAIFRSTDGGRLWTNVNNGLPDTLVSALAASRAGSSAGTLFMGTMSGKMFHSVNEGTTWVRDTAGLPASGFITSLIVSDKTGTVIMHTGSWIYRSVDAGLHWAKIFLKSGMHNFTMHQGSGQMFILAYATGPTATLYRSADDGLTWQDAGSILPNIPGSRMLMDSTGHMWVGHTLGGQVYRTQQVVPVTFTSFSGWLNQGHALLRWSTVYEARNFGFSIERKDNAGEWSSIGFVSGAGSSDALCEYTFTDPAVLTAPTIYRLRQTDFDGAVQYSSEITVYAGAEKPAAFAILGIAPFPAHGETELRFLLGETGNVNISICDVLGRSRTQLLDDVRAPGTHVLHMDASTLAPGLYLIKGSTKTETAVRTLLVR